MVVALQLLMAELGNPELKGKGKEIVNNLNVNISNPNLKQQLQEVANSHVVPSSANPLKFGGIVNATQSEVPQNFANRSISASTGSKPHQNRSVRPTPFAINPDDSDGLHSRMVTTSSVGTPFAGDQKSTFANHEVLSKQITDVALSGGAIEVSVSSPRYENQES